MNKKAMSQLIAWVLLVGFAIAMGAFITSWSLGYFKNINLGGSTEPELYCDEVQIGINNVCLKTDALINLSLTNKGKFSISRITFSRETSNSSLASCIYINADLVPENSTNYLINIVTSLNSFGTLSECPTIGSSLGDAQVINIGLTPWIEIENKNIACSDKKISINDRILLNKPC